jgi:hypothetical protein
MKQHTIYNSNTYETYTDEDIIQNFLENDPEITKEDISDDDIYNERDFLAQMDFDDECVNLNKELSNKILCIASLGLWYGNRTGYKILDNNLKSILYQAQGDYYHVYYDGYNVVAKDCHHDGTNYYTFRLIKDNVNIDNLLNKLYSGTATNNDINNYTKSLRDTVKRIYGWR